MCHGWQVFVGCRLCAQPPSFLFPSLYMGAKITHVRITFYFFSFPHDLINPLWSLERVCSPFCPGEGRSAGTRYMFQALSSAVWAQLFSWSPVSRLYTRKGIEWKRGFREVRIKILHIATWNYYFSRWPFGHIL